MAEDAYEVQFTAHNAGPSYASNLDLDSKHYGPFAEMIHEYRKVAGNEHTVYLLVTCAPGLNHAMDLASKSMSLAKTRDPLNDWSSSDQTSIFQGFPIIPYAYRPKYCLPPTDNFLDEKELCIVQGFGHLQEIEYVAKQSIVRLDFQARILEHPAGKGKALLLIVDTTSESENKPSITKGDSFMVRIRALNPKDLGGLYWYERVLDKIHFPFLNANEVLIFIESPRDPETKHHLVIDTSPLGTLASIDQLNKGFQHDLKVVSELKPFAVELRRIGDEKPAKALEAIMVQFRKRIASERSHYGGISPTEDLFCGRQQRRLPITNLFEGVNAEYQQDMYARLTEEQQAAMLESSRLRARTALFPGFAGTGKSFMVLQSTIPIYRQFPKSQILVVSPMNDHADSVTLKYASELQQYDPDVRVLRLFSSSTERAIFLMDAKKERGPKRPGPIDPEVDFELMGMVNEITVGHNILKGFHAATKTKLGLSDGRVTQKTLTYTVGYEIGRRIGAYGQPPTRDDEATKDLKHMYEEYRRGSFEDEETKERFRSLIEEAWREVVRSANVIVCTPTRAIELGAKNVFKPLIVIMEKCSRITTLEAMGLRAFYLDAARVFLVTGDRLQSALSTKSPLSFNGFAGQTQVSFFLQLLANHFPCVELVNTQRFGRTICEAISTSLLSGEMTFNPKFTLGEQRLEDALQNIMDRGNGKIDMPGQIMVLNVNQGREIVVGRHRTRLNRQSAAVDFELVRNLIIAGKHITGKDVAILTPYTGQRDLLSRHRASLLANGSSGIPDLEHLMIDTFDNSQGNQRFAIVCDLTATDTPGCLTERARLFIGLSRARGILIIVCNLDKLTTAFHQRSWGPQPHIDLLDYLKLAGLRRDFPRGEDAITKLQAWPHVS